MSQQQLQAIAALSFQIPVSDSGTSISSQSRGTVDLDDVDTEVPAMDEVITLTDRETFRIGRSRTNDLVLQNGSVSRHHAVFSASSAGLVLSDLSSLNGTFVNSKRITHPINLATGDVVKVGHTKIGIEILLGGSQEEDFSALQTQSTAMRSVMVTVLVADISNYTQMSQAVPTDKLAQMLDTWFRRTAAVISNYGGEIDKYIGDCVMALWKSKEEEVGKCAEQAVNAGREILQVTEELSSSGEWPFAENYPWQCRVVLNTGDALFGSLGPTEVRAYTVLGNTVNVTFRLEGLESLKQHKLIFSATTALRLPKEFPMKSLGHVIIDGQSENIEVFTVG